MVVRAAVVALKAGPAVKSRLSGLSAPVRRQLAWAMATDTLAALVAAMERVLVISDQPDLGERLRQEGLDVDVLPERERAGLNAALRRGDAAVRAAGARTVLACVGDLPALQPATVNRVVTATPADSRAFVPDASGVGTTMLVARDRALDPHFGSGSAARHATSGAIALGPDLLGSVADARRDVDTMTDLAEALRLGVGAATRVVVAGATELRSLPNR